MGKRGLKRQYTIKREAYLTPELDAVLDRLRGEMPRSEYIRRLIEFADYEFGEWVTKNDAKGDT